MQTVLFGVQSYWEQLFIFPAKIIKLIESLCSSYLWSCNNLFSRFEQQTSILEKLDEATDPTMDRHGHDGPSKGLVSKHLENLKLGTEN